MNGYFCCQTPSHSSTGEITKIIGPKNNKNFHALYAEALARDHNEKDPANYIFVSVITAVTATYQTRYQADRTDYFLGDEKVDEPSWRRIVKFDSVPLAFELGSDDFDTLLKKADQYAEFSEKCAVRRTETHSFSLECPEGMKFWGH
jgi:hypothetical protein